MARKDELIQELADKYHVDPKEVRRAVESQFKFVAEKMAEPDFPQIRLPFFGVFKANRTRIKHLNDARRKKEHKSK